MNDLEKMVRILEFADTGYPEKQPGRKRRPVWMAAAAAVMLAQLMLAIMRPSQHELVDTYDSPELAYAKVEEVFQQISSSIDKSIDRTEIVYFKITNHHE